MAYWRPLRAAETLGSIRPRPGWHAPCPQGIPIPLILVVSARVQPGLLAPSSSVAGNVRHPPREPLGRPRILPGAAPRAPSRPRPRPGIRSACKQTFLAPSRRASGRKAAVGECFEGLPSLRSLGSCDQLRSAGPLEIGPGSLDSPGHRHRSAFPEPPPTSSLHDGVGMSDRRGSQLRVAHQQEGTRILWRRCSVARRARSAPYPILGAASRTGVL